MHIIASVLESLVLNERAVQMRKRLYAITCAACVGAWMCQAEPVDLAGKDLCVASVADSAADGYVNSAE